jgi:hypothetical protein
MKYKPVMISSQEAFAIVLEELFQPIAVDLDGNDPVRMRSLNIVSSYINQTAMIKDKVEQELVRILILNNQSHQSSLSS